MAIDAGTPRRFLALVQSLSTGLAQSEVPGLREVWYPLAEGGKFTKPKDHSLAEFSTLSLGYKRQAVRDNI